MKKQPKLHKFDDAVGHRCKWNAEPKYDNSEELVCCSKLWHQVTCKLCLRHKPKPWHMSLCHKCNLKAGGKVPKGQGGITVHAGHCDHCGKATTIVPGNDYNWPMANRKAWFD